MGGQRQGNPLDSEGVEMGYPLLKTTIFSMLFVCFLVRVKMSQTDKRTNLGRRVNQKVRLFDIANHALDVMLIIVKAPLYR